MSCVETLNAACKEAVAELAGTIDGEMKAIVGGHTRSGMALGAIHIENRGLSAFVGGTGGTGKGINGTDHLAMLNDGNGGGRIYPRHAKALYLKDYNIWRGSVRTYGGIHFVEAIASRHGG